MEGAARRLGPALAASVALHAAVLSGVVMSPSPPPKHVVRLEPMAARLVEPAAEALPAPVPAEEKKPVVKTPPVVQKKVVAAVPAKSVVLAPAPPVAAVIAPPAPVPPAAPASPAVQPSAPPAPDAATVGQYRVLLIGAAGRYKRYPEQAREKNWTGNVVVGVAVGAGGVPEVGVRRSSGHAVLDEQALEMFRQAARAVPVPERLRGRAFSLEVRAIYGLED